MWEKIRESVLILGGDVGVLCRRRPTILWIVMISLGVGVGALGTVALYANAVLFKPLAVRAPSELIQFYWETRSWLPDRQRLAGAATLAPLPSSPTFTTSSFVALRQALERDADVCAFTRPSEVSAKIDGVVRNASLQFVSDNYFRVLGISSVLGNVSNRESVGREAAVVSHGFWQTTLGGRPDVVGELLEVDGRSFTIRGVAEEGFTGTAGAARLQTQIWIGLGAVDRLAWGVDTSQQWWLQVVARTRDGLAREVLAAVAEPSFQASIAGEALPPPTDDVPSLGAWSARLGSRDNDHGEELRYATLLALVSGSLLVLLSVSLTGLMATWASSRQPEWSIRIALGASPSALTRQVLAESVFIGSIGSVIAVGVAHGAKGWLVASGLVQDPTSLAIDYRVLFGSWAVAVTVSVMTSLWPTLRLLALGTDRHLGGREFRTKSRVRGRAVLLMVEVAAAVVVTNAALLVSDELRTMSASALGIRSGDLLTFEIQPATVGIDEVAAGDLVHKIERSLLEVPGIRGVTATTPFWRSGWPGRIVRRGIAERISSRWLAVGPRFFSTLEVPLRLGRALAVSDSVRPPRTAVVDESLAKVLFDGQNPIGQYLRFDQNELELEVVGVAADVRFADGRRDRDVMTLYVPETATREDFDPANVELRGRQRDSFGRTFFVRAAPGSTDIGGQILASVRAADPRVYPVDLDTFDGALGRRVAPLRIVAGSWVIIGAVALTLTCVGIFGVVSQSVADGRRDIAVRRALGASTVRVALLVVGQVGRNVCAGLVLGCGIAVVSGRSLEGFVPIDLSSPMVLAGACFVVIVASTAAVVGPARRAIELEPIEELRHG